MNEIRQIRRAAERHHRADHGLAQGLCCAQGTPRYPRSVPRNCARRPERAAGQGLRSVGPLYGRRGADRSRRRPAARARGLDRGARLGGGRAARDQARGQRQRLGRPSRAAVPGGADVARGTSRRDRHAARIRPRRDRHRGNDLCRAPRESGARGGGRGRVGRAPRRWRKLRRGHSRIRDARIRARGSGARARDHSRQHQSPRTRADGDRPQFSRQGQRQHRQFGGELRRRRGSREDGVGDPLGRRHGDGPLDRPQHPQYPLLDRPQRAGADRHGADLPGAGEGRRRSAQARLGSVQGHADRAGRAGRRLFHHPRRRAPRPCAADRETGHRHRLARRLDHGALVPRRPSRELPLRALRRHLRHHARLRRFVLAWRRPASWLDRRRQRRRAIRRARDAGRTDQGRLGQGLPGDDRRPRPCADAQDQGQHGKAAQANAARRRSTRSGR